MRESDFCANVRRGLLRLGFGRGYAMRVARELEEHHSDLVEEGLRQGLSRTEAEDRASAGLGSADSLVHDFGARLQGSTWLGRHQTFGFALLGLVGTLVWWAVFVSVVGSASGLFWTEKKPGAPAAPVDFFIASVDWIRATSYVAVPWLICWIARRKHCGWKAALWGCLIVAVHNAMHSFVVSGAMNSNTITWGYTFSSAGGPGWLPVLAPLAVFAIDLAWNVRPDLPATANPKSTPTNHEIPLVPL